MSNQVLCHWSISIATENIRKAEVFRFFRGVYKETSSAGWNNGV